MKCDCNVDFLVFQEADLRYMVESVWNSQSILSAWDELFDLVLVRWDKHEVWSPWNCVLLTKEEAEAHRKLKDLEEVTSHIMSSLKKYIKILCLFF